jgi:hypothetical protein
MRPTQIIKLGICTGLLLATSACYAPISDPRIPEYAAQCNAGYAASCIAMQAIYSNAQTQATIDNNDELAAHARIQNFWLAQQQSNDATFNNVTNQINFSRAQLMNQP